MSKRKHLFLVVTAAICLLWAFALSTQAVAPQTIRTDISNALVTVEDTLFTGTPVTPEVKVSVDGVELDPDTDYDLYWTNNVNAGSGTVRIVGAGEYYGSCARDFNITLSGSHIPLKGNYNGNLEDGELGEDAFTAEFYVCPGVFTGAIATDLDHEVYYSLYQLEDETPRLILQKSISISPPEDTCFIYDFSDIYEKPGGQVFMLSYAWVDEVFDYHCGIAFLNVASKVGPASTMRLDCVQGDPDIAYLFPVGEDGVISAPEWTSSDSRIATVENGVVSFHSPGNVTITCTAGDLSASHTFDISQKDIADALFYSYDPVSDQAVILMDGVPLTQGKHYTLSAEEEEETVTVTVNGCGLFLGQLQKTFPKVQIPAGDMNTDGQVDSADVEYLLMHTLYKEDYPVSANADFIHDGIVDARDVEYLLMHTLYPKDYPLE